MEKMPYEFHVTIAAQAERLEAFRATCEELRVKPIVLDLGVNNDEVLSDYMTSSTATYTSDVEAFNRLQKLSRNMCEAGFTVVRQKIETAPWHNKAPQKPEDIMPEGCYFEAHLALNVLAMQVPELRGRLRLDENAPALHLSRNSFKQASAGRLVMMATLRSYLDTSQTFSEHVEASRNYLTAEGYELEKDPIIEFALYDSNVHHDDNWMKNGQ